MEVALLLLLQHPQQKLLLQLLSLSPYLLPHPSPQLLPRHLLLLQLLPPRLLLLLLLLLLRHPPRLLLQHLQHPQHLQHLPVGRTQLARVTSLRSFAS